MEKYKYLLKDTIIFALGNIGSKLLLFLLVPLYTAYMTSEEYGTSDLVFTVSQLLLPLISLVIFDGIMRFGLSKSYKAPDVLLCGYISLLFGAFILAMSSPLISIYTPIAPWKWYLMVYTFFAFWLSIHMNYLKVKSLNKIYSIISVFQTFIMAALNILFLVILHTGVQGFLLSNILAAGVAICLSFALGGLGSDLKKARFDRQLYQEMIIFSAPLVLNNISWWVIQASDKVMVEYFLGVSALGIYTVASKIPSLINVMTNIFSQAWGISSVKEIESTNDTQFYSTVFEMYHFFSCGVCMVLISIIKPFMNVYIHSAFGEAWHYVPLLLCAAVFASVAYFFGSLYGALKKSVNNMLTTLLAALVNIVVNYLLLSHIGLYGAVLGTLLSYIVMSTARLLDIQRFIPLSFSKMKYLLNCSLMLIQACLIMFDRHMYIVSCLMLGLYIFVNKEKLQQMAVLFKRR